MKDINFQLTCIQAELPAIQLDNGTWLFHAHVTCEFTDVASKTHESRWIGENIPPKWVQEFRRFDQVGRPALYLLLPGFLYTLSQGNSEVALKFRNEIYEEILPSIINNGGYVSPNATPEQLAIMQSQIDIQQSMILDMGRELSNLTSKKHEFETRRNDWETDIQNDVNGDPLVYYTFLKKERGSYVEDRDKWKNQTAELESQMKQLEAIKKAVLRLKPTKTNQPLLQLVQGQ
jgi:hypothetical protein